MCFWTRIARIWRIIIRVIRVRITIREFRIKYDIYSSNTEKIVFKFVFMSSSSVRKTLFCCSTLTLLFWLKRASFATKESLFFSKVGKVTFSARKSFLCRYFALSLHLETGRESGQFRSRLPRVPSLCLRSGFALGGEEKHKAMRQQRQGTNESSFLCNRRSLASA